MKNVLFSWLQTLLVTVILIIALIALTQTTYALETQRIGQIETVTVSNVKDFAREISSNKKIILKEGKYNLLDLKNDVSNAPDGALSQFVSVGVLLDSYRESSDTYPCLPAAMWVRNVQNLFIEGEIREKVEIIAPDNLLTVMVFQNSNNIKITNVTLTHDIPKGYCGGDVLGWLNCQNATIKNVTLHGSGMNGLVGYNLFEMHFDDSEITVCRRSAIDISSSNFLYFANSKFTNIDVKESLMSFKNTLKVNFDSCFITDNLSANTSGKSVLKLDNVINASKSRIKFYKTLFKNNSGLQLGDILPVQFDSCKFENNTFAPVNNSENRVITKKLGNDFELIDPQFDEVNLQENGYFIVKKDKKYAVLDSGGNFVVPYQQYEIVSFNTEVGVIKSDEMWGIIDNKGTIVVAPKFKVRFLDYASNDFGFMDHDSYSYQGKLKFKEDYFSEGLAVVDENDKFGFIDITGKFVINPEYDYASNFINGLAVVRKDGSSGIIDKTGNFVIPLKPFEIKNLYLGTAKFTTQPAIEVREDGLYDKSLNKKIEARETGLYDKSQNKMNVDSYLLNLWNKLKSTPKEKEIIDILKYQYSKSGMLNKSGKVIINPLYDDIIHYSENMFAFKQNNVWGIMNANEEVIIAPRYLSVGFDDTGILLVHDLVDGEKVCGIVNSEGKVVVEPAYKYICFWDLGMFKMCKEIDYREKWGVMDKTGKIIINPDYDSVELNDSQIFTLKTSGGNTYADKSGKIISEPGILKQRFEKNEFFFENFKNTCCSIGTDYLKEKIDLFSLENSTKSAYKTGFDGSFNNFKEYGILINKRIKIKAGDNYLSFDVDPINKDGRLLVPMRTLFEALGVPVSWDDKTKTVVAQKDNSLKMELKIGSNQAIVNGKAVKLDVSAMVVDGRTLVPLRFISESLGAKVSWDDLIKTAVISY